MSILSQARDTLARVRVFKGTGCVVEWFGGSVLSQALVSIPRAMFVGVRNLLLGLAWCWARLFSSVRTRELVAASSSRRRAWCWAPAAGGAVGGQSAFERALSVWAGGLARTDSYTNPLQPCARGKRGTSGHSFLYGSARQSWRCPLSRWAGQALSKLLIPKHFIAQNGL